MERTDDELLVAGVTDVEAFAAFYRRHAAPLAGFFLARTGNRELAADLTAETFAAALGARRKFDPAKGPAVGWLYGIARNKLLKAFERGAVEDRARKRLRMNRLVLDDEALEQVEIRESIKPLLESLPPREKKILLLRFFGNMTQSQIAEEIGVSQMHVSRLLTRTLAQLRTSLEQD